MDAKEKLLHVCSQAMKDKKLNEDKRYLDRLLLEFRELNIQMEHEYFVDLHLKNVKFAKNENNLLIAYLAGLCDDFDIDAPPIYVQGEYPDIDSDFHPLVRNYLKTKWAPEFFGEENVCSIGNYTTFGIKSSLIDMARVHGKDRNEILALTTKLGLKDEDGKVLDFDGALRESPELKEWCDANPDVAEATRRILNRNRGMGKHAGGLIISKSSISDLVPLVKGSDGSQVSAFVEGLHGTDLGPLGLIKFDLLVITNLMQIAKACKLIKERHGLRAVCAFDGDCDWSDDSYLNDPAALEMANRGDLKCIFQFDSDGIRKLVKSGGVTSFDDLVAYSALYRPGCLKTGMAQRYVDRKKGKEKFEIHPLLEPIIGKTYGVMVFQEQIMKLLNIVGDIPAMHCEIIRKAISKKKIETFGKYKEMFLINGQKKLGWTYEEVLDLWMQIEAFAEYGFNKSHSCAYSMVSARLLYLKAHYPLEFYAAVLSCEKEQIKYKEYKLEGKTHDVAIEPVTLNHSKVKFDIDNDKIYMGYANIKGIGDEIAEILVKKQPYVDFEDFLKRFGTDLKVVKPLVALRLFGDDPRSLWEYFEYYKARQKQNEDRQKRFMKSKEKLMVEANAILDINGDPLNLTEEFVYDLPEKSEGNVGYIEMQLGTTPEDAKTLLVIAKKLRRAVLSNRQKNDTPELQIIPYADFEASGYVDPGLAEIFADRKSAEEEFYGFIWDHWLEASEDYEGGWTFADFDDAIEKEDVCVRMCEVHIVEKPKCMKTKTNKDYYTVIVEDANSRRHMVSFWSEDWKRFQPELEYWEDDIRKGHFVKMRLKRPDEGFSRYTFDSPHPRLRSREIPKEKEKDWRLIVMKRPIALAESHQFSNEEKYEGLIDINMKVIEI